MNYVTTNIRISEEDYLRLKNEAAKKRKSLSAVVRDRLSSQDNALSKAEIIQIMDKTRELAKRNSQYLKGIDGVKVIREMRDNEKW